MSLLPDGANPIEVKSHPPVDKRGRIYPTFYPPTDPSKGPIEFFGLLTNGNKSTIYLVWGEYDRRKIALALSTERSTVAFVTSIEYNQTSWSNDFDSLGNQRIRNTALIHVEIPIEDDFGDLMYEDVPKAHQRRCDTFHGRASVMAKQAAYHARIQKKWKGQKVMQLQTRKVQLHISGKLINEIQKATHGRDYQKRIILKVRRTMDHNQYPPVTYSVTAL